jgi:hypothetical protein
MIASFTEGLFEKDQFKSRTKGRIAERNTEIRPNSGDINRQEQAPLAAERIREIAATIEPNLADAD